MSTARVLPVKPSEANLSNASRDYGDLMEETDTMSIAAETNGVADHNNASTSNADEVCVTRAEDDSPVQQVRVHVANETLESRTLSNGNQEPDRSEQNIDHEQSPSAEAATAPVATEPLADAMPQAILGTGTLRSKFDSRSSRGD